MALASLDFLKRLVLATVALAMLAALLAAGMLLIAGPGYRLEWWELGPAFDLLRRGAYLGLSAALLAAVAGGLALWLGRRRTATVALVAVLVGAIAVTIPYNWRAQARSVPPIHDISTDTTNPPEFVAIAPLREDAPNPVEYAGEETARAQHEGYPDIRTVWTERPPGDVFSAAVEVVTRMGWELVETDAGEGRIEATDITRWFGFKDDVVIRLTADQGGTLIDVRSKSRVGTSDVGTNAERIRAFLRRLEGALEN
jgi:hypothetical protein